jgi:putative nucleotidyltransferase with HDIG domain
LFEKTFNLLTNARLIDLTDHNFPLIKRLITETPGTFNHALNVANFAEVCATAIGDNPYLARAAAYYHDIGKLANPQFFKENQSGDNPHDSLLPEVSAEIIRSHTVEGLALCKKYRIPKEIALVTLEHHGTMAITMFLDKAKKLTDGEVDIRQYSYSGVTPTTKIAAIIMICDIAEAALRAGQQDLDKVEEMVSSMIWQRVKNGQFDNCDITIKELTIIKDTIMSAHSGVYHKRLKYPDGK